MKQKWFLEEFSKRRDTVDGPSLWDEVSCWLDSSEVDLAAHNNTIQELKSMRAADYDSFMKNLEAAFSDAWDKVPAYLRGNLGTTKNACFFRVYIK